MGKGIRYSDEYKLEAVNQVVIHGYPVSEVSQRLGTSTKSLYAWLQKFTLATDIDVYFCDPRSPWQRGANEDTNGLLRQYFPKGKCLSNYTQFDLNRTAAKLNTRPRKTICFLTSAAMLGQVVR